MKAIKIEASRSVERKSIRGVEFLVSVSPYFFPERLECDYDLATGAYVIHFKYLDNEPRTPSAEDGDDMIDIEVGRHTGRLLTIRVQVDRHDLDQIRFFVTDRIPKAILHIAGAQPQAEANYRIATDAILNHQAELLECAVDRCSF